MSSDRDTFLARWAQVIGSGYLAIGHDVWDDESGRVIHVGGWRRYTSPDHYEDIPHPRGYNSGIPWIDIHPHQGVRIAPQPCTQALPGRNWTSSVVPPTWRFVVLDIDKSDLDKAGWTVPMLHDTRRRIGLPDPWCAVYSGSGGVHLWWALDRPVHRDTVRGWQRAMVAMLHGDAAQTGIRQSLRLPGTLNAKFDGRPSNPCSIDHNRSSWQLVDPTAFARLPSPLELPRDPMDGDDTPSWARDLLRQMGVRCRRTKASGVTPLDVCPTCRQRGTAYVIGRRVNCHRTSCQGIPDLADVAPNYGIDTSQDIRIETDSRMTPMVHITSSRDEQAAAMRDAFGAWSSKLGMAGADREIHVIQSGVGVGKDVTIMPLVDQAWRDSLHSYAKIAISTVTVDDAYRKTRELHDPHHHGGRSPVTIYSSPLGHTLPDGSTCTQPRRLQPYSDGGYGAQRGCDGCPDYDDCRVRIGHHTVQGPDDTAPPLPMISHRRLIGTSDGAVLDGVVIDEALPLVTSSSVTADELDAFARLCVRDMRSRRIIDPATGITTTTSDPLIRWSAIATAIATHIRDMPSSGYWSPSSDAVWAMIADTPGDRDAILAAPRPVPTPVLVPGPKGRVCAYPACVMDVIMQLLDPSPDAALVCSDGTLSIYTRTLDRLPRRVLWTDASYWIHAEQVQRWAEKSGVKLTTYGGHMRQNLKYMLWRRRRAVRGSSEAWPTRPGYTLGGTKTTRECILDLRRAIEAMVDEWRIDHDTDPKILIGTYKCIWSEYVTETSEIWVVCRELETRLGCTIDLAHYNQTIGTNRWQDFEMVLALGAPNYRCGDTDIAEALLYGRASESLMRRYSEHLIYQLIGRIRPDLESTSIETRKIVGLILPWTPLSLPVDDWAMADQGAFESPLCRAWRRWVLATGVVDVNYSRTVLKLLRLVGSNGSDVSGYAVKILERIGLERIVAQMSGVQISDRRTFGYLQIRDTDNAIADPDWRTGQSANSATVKNLIDALADLIIATRAHGIPSPSAIREYTRDAIDGDDRPWYTCIVNQSSMRPRRIRMLSGQRALAVIWIDKVLRDATGVQRGSLTMADVWIESVDDGI